MTLALKKYIETFENLHEKKNARVDKEIFFAYPSIFTPLFLKRG